jgi:hypothetical protein
MGLTAAFASQSLSIARCTRSGAREHQYARAIAIAVAVEVPRRTDLVDQSVAVRRRCRTGTSTPSSTTEATRRK